MATQYFGIAVSVYRLEELVRDTERLLNAATFNERNAAMRRDLMRVEDRSRAFFGALALARRTRGPMTDERLRIGPDWFGDIVDDGLLLVSALSGLEGAMALAGGVDTGASSGGKTNDDALTLARRAGEVRDELKFLLAANDPMFV